MIKIHIKGDIIPDDYKLVYRWMGWSYACPYDIRAALEKAGGEDVTVDINSPGGVCNAAFEIYTALREYGGTVTVQVVGLAASAASLIACAGDTVRISPVGIFMIHNAACSASGDYRDMDAAAASLRQYNAAVINAYVARTGMDRKELQDLMDHTTYLSSETAMEYGFADAVMDFGEGGTEEEEASGTPEGGTGCDLMAVASVSGVNLIHPGRMREISLAIRQMQERESSAEDSGEISGRPNLEDGEDALLFDISKLREGGNSEMTLEELKEKSPDLAAEIEQLVHAAEEKGREEGVKQGGLAERDRMKAIDSIAASLPETMVSEAKYTNPVNAQELALAALQKNAKAGAAYLKGIASDFEQSGAADVEAVPSEASDPEDASDALANAANAKKGKK